VKKLTNEKLSMKKMIIKAIRIDIIMIFGISFAQSQNNWFVALSISIFIFAIGYAHLLAMVVMVAIPFFKGELISFSGDE